MGRTRTHGEATRNALLDVAERLLEAEGPDGVSVRRVSEELGLTTRAIYSTFGSKDALVGALGERAFELLSAGVSSAPVTADPARDLVGVGAGAFRGFVTDHPGLFHLAFAVVGQSSLQWTLMAEANRVAFQNLQDRVRRLQQAGGIGKRSVRAAATQFHCLCEGLAINEQRGNLGSPRAAKTVWTQALGALVLGWPAS